ncbi:MAG: NUDIX hydrolase [Verrucomicrobia bacterium]|nr:NUDIX hydrolase [Verrucomicrobiota bacterium]
MKEAGIGIIFSPDRKKVLLIKRRDVPLWVLPGGGIDPGESPEEATLREVFEETGLKVTIRRKIGTWLPINRLTRDTFVFECSPVADSQEPSPQEESLDVRFWPVHELPIITFFLHEEWIEAALKDLPQPICEYITSITYFTCLKLLVSHPILALRYILARLGLPINLRSRYH